MSFDTTSYIVGHEAGKGKVVIEGAITCTDDGDGNVTITEAEEEENE